MQLTNQGELQGRGGTWQVRWGWGMWHVRWGGEKRIQASVEKSEAKRQPERLGVDVKVTLKWILRRIF